jgi:hypothetical protein
LGKIQLLQRIAPELRQECGYIGSLQARSEEIPEYPKREGDRVQVSQDQGRNVGTLNLDRNVGSILQGCAVNLRQRSCRGRCRVEGHEDLIDRLAEFSLENSRDLRYRHFRYMFLQNCQGIDVGLRQKVGPRAEYLSQLDKGRPERDQSCGEVRRSKSVWAMDVSPQRAVFGQQRPRDDRQAQQVTQWTPVWRLCGNHAHSAARHRHPVQEHPAIAACGARCRAMSEPRRS